MQVRVLHTYESFLIFLTYPESRRDSYFQFPRSPLETPRAQSPFCVLNTEKKNDLQIMTLGAKQPRIIMASMFGSSLDSTLLDVPNSS